MIGTDVPQGARAASPARRAALAAFFLAVTLTPKASADVELQAGLGVPIPLRVYGLDPSLQGSDARLELLVASRFRALYRLSESRWGLGSSVETRHARLATGDLEITAESCRLGPELTLRVLETDDERWALSLAVAPTYSFTHVRVDAELNDDVDTFGAHLDTWLSWMSTRHFGAFLSASVAYDAPPSRATVFGDALGTSWFLVVLLGPTVRV